MLRHAAASILAMGTLLLAPSTAAAPGLSEDATPPSVTVNIFGTLGDNGWYRSNVTLNWTVSDPESPITSSSGCDAVTFTSDTTGVSRTCTATSDGGTTAVTKPLKIDKTAPTASTSARAADSNGWHNHDVTISFSGTDATSGIASCEPSKTYGGPDTQSTTITGTCRDRAGNQSASAGFTLKYDETAPSASAATGRGPDSNGWFNQSVAVNFSGNDGMSGLASCDAPKTYNGPDTSTTSVSGSCRDRAGNSKSASVTLRYDATAPSASASPGRGPGPTGWYNSALPVSFSGSDALSSPVSCDPAKTYDGPDSATASVAGSCRDQAGNSKSASLTLKYDDTAPHVTLVPERTPDANGWFNHPVTVAFSGVDATSGLISCDAPKTYGGPDDSSASVSGLCRDRAGNAGGAAIGLPYDATAPAVSAVPARAADSNGWYNSAVAVGFHGSDPTSGVDSCTAPVGYDGPDSRTASVAGSCRDRAGNTAGASFGFRYDATAPQVTPVPARGPDSNGWYNRPLSVAFAGADGTAGVDGCSSTAYSGPDDASASAWGTCRDAAGNVGVGRLSFKYDDTAPAIGTLRVKRGNRSAELTWKASGDAQIFEVRREPGLAGGSESVVYRGSASSFRDKGLTVAVKYRYTVIAQDGAANRADESAVLTATGPLLSPAPGERVSAPPRLVWTPVKRATYYHVQLLRNRRVLSAWPPRASFQVRRAWRYQGRRYRLRPGVYRWYVWPGYGRPSQARFGKRIGGSTFVVGG